MTWIPENMSLKFSLNMFRMFKGSVLLKLTLKQQFYIFINFIIKKLVTIDSVTIVKNRRGARSNFMFK